MKLNQQIALGIIAVSTMTTAVALAVSPPSDEVDIPRTNMALRCHVLMYSITEPPADMLSVLRAAYAYEHEDPRATIRWDRLDGRIVACAKQEVHE